MNATLTVDERTVLDALNIQWRAVFDISCDGFRWRAKRWDGTGEPLTGRTPDDIAAAMTTEWANW